MKYDKKTSFLPLIILTHLLGKISLNDIVLSIIWQEKAGRSIEIILPSIDVFL